MLNSNGTLYCFNPLRSGKFVSDTIRKGEQVGDIGIFGAYSLEDLVIEEGKT
jgi:hypothetical protein